MRTTRTARRSTPPTLLLAGGAACAALACADAPTAAPAPRPAASLAGRAVPAGAPRAAIRVLSVSALPAPPQRYEYNSEAWRVNARGQAIGMGPDPAGGAWSYERTGYVGGRGVLWDGTSAIDLTAATYAPGSVPRAIANDGTVYYEWGINSYRWNGVSAWLGAPPSGCTGVHGLDVNDAALVVGYTYCADDERTAAVRDPAGGWRRLPGRGVGPRPGDRFETAAWGVNRGGDVAGGSPSGWAGGPILPSLWVAPTYARTLIDCRPGCTEGWARDVNIRRWMVGVLFDAGAAASRAFLWTPAGGLERIPPLPGDTRNGAYGIDGWNRVVGMSWGGGAGPRAFVWTRRYGTQPLGEIPGDGGSKAFGIADGGRVVGSSGSYDCTINPYVAVDFCGGRHIHAVMWQLESWILTLMLDQTIVRSSPANTQVVVVGAAGFDAMSVDPSTLRLGDEVGEDTPPARDAKGSPIAYAKDANGDGIVDLVVEFSIPALVKNGDVAKETTELLLTGALAQGTPLHGVVKVAVAP